MKGTVLAALLLAASGPAAAQDDPLVAAQARMPKVKKRRRFDPLPPAEAFAPELVCDAAAFAVTQADIDAVRKAQPDPASALGGRLAAMMRRAYVGGRAPEDSVAAPSLRVLTWNVNAARGAKSIDALVAIFKDSPAGLAAAMGHRGPLKGKAVRQLDEISRTDIFLMQEIPLPTAIALGKALGYQVFWAPEFLEVGDNAKGRDPVAAEDYTGNAILSRVALADFKVLRFANQADWYVGQKKGLEVGDKLQAIAAKILFAIDMGNPHQTRPWAPYGGRAALFAKTRISGGREVWVGDLHLEDLGGVEQSGPALRRAQMGEAIAFIRGVKEPMVLGGDLNTMGGDVGVGEGEDLAAEAPNVMRLAQPPVDRQHGLASGTGNKFFGLIDAGNLATTLAVDLNGADTLVTRNDDGSLTTKRRGRKKLAAEQTALLAIDVVPYAPTAHDGLDAIKEIKRDHGAGSIALHGGEVAADFFPYTAAGAKGFKIWREEKARHDPSSVFNADHKLFRDAGAEGIVPLNPRQGKNLLRLGTAGYQSTWTAQRPMIVPKASKGLVDTVTDWMFLRDNGADRTLAPTRAEVYRDVVLGSKGDKKVKDGGATTTGSRLSDHFPMGVELPIVQPPARP